MRVCGRLPVSRERCVRDDTVTAFSRRTDLPLKVTVDFDHWQAAEEVFLTVISGEKVVASD